jgi:hypothetical protein
MKYKLTILICFISSISFAAENKAMDNLIGKIDDLQSSIKTYKGSVSYEGYVSSYPRHKTQKSVSQTAKETYNVIGIADKNWKYSMHREIYFDDKLYDGVGSTHEYEASYDAKKVEEYYPEFGFTVITSDGGQNILDREQTRFDPTQCLKF